MKPTHGLVPYTGIMPIEITVDHTGPMTANVRDNALLLEVIAGPDGYDPRQYAPRVQPYTQLLAGGVRGLRIAVVREGFQQPGAEPDVGAKVQAAAALLGTLGATVRAVSIPEHLVAGAVFLPIVTEGSTQTMLEGDGYGVSRSDLYVTSLMDFHRNWRTRADELSETVKLFALLGTYIREQHGSRYYGKATNIARRITAAYDAVLAEHDLLLMPTTPMKVQPLPARGAPREEVIGRAMEMVWNTAPFDVTHHPAMAIPCGMSDGLPISVMLVGKHFDEATIYRAAYAYEQSGDWRTR
jgi:amidase